MQFFIAYKSTRWNNHPKLLQAFFSSLKTINNSFKRIFKRDFDLNLNIPLLGIILLAFDWYNNGGQIRRVFIHQGSLDLFCTYIILDLCADFLLS